MGKRSLQVQTQYQQQVRDASISLGLTQKAIAARLNCSRQPVSKFFNCKPVSYQLFVEICTILKLDWQEIASLKTICLTFEESGDFPGNRAGLYKEGLDALLKKWDAKRGIKRDQVYQKLWVQRKEDLLSKIAWDTFAPGEYFFKQDKAERYIGEYIRNLPGASSDEEALRLDSEVVLKSIESQHGLLVARAKNIYSIGPHHQSLSAFAVRPRVEPL